MHLQSRGLNSTHPALFKDKIAEQIDTLKKLDKFPKKGLDIAIVTCISYHVMTGYQARS